MLQNDNCLELLSCIYIYAHNTTTTNNNNTVFYRLIAAATIAFSKQKGAATL